MSGLPDASADQPVAGRSETVAAGPEIIVHEATPGNILYPGLGRPCPRCKSFFSCSHDFDAHEKVCKERQWRKSDYDDSYICPSEKEPELTHACLVNGSVRNGLYTYTLSQDRRYLKRKENH
jgi:hypothetical protein